MDKKNDDFDMDNPELKLAAESFDTDSVTLTDGADLRADVGAPAGSDDL